MLVHHHRENTHFFTSSLIWASISFMKRNLVCMQEQPEYDYYKVSYILIDLARLGLYNQIIGNVVTLSSTAVLPMEN